MAVTNTKTKANPESVAWTLSEGSRRPLVQVLGPYGAPTPELIRLNVEEAQRVGVELRKLGCDVYVPHAASVYIETRLSEDEWLADSIAHLRRADAAVVLRGYQKSTGTRAEVLENFEEIGVPMFGVLSSGRLPRSLIAWVEAFREGHL